MGRRKRVTVPCSGFVGATGVWVRCSEQGVHDAWSAGIYCDRHAVMLTRLRGL